MTAQQPLNMPALERLAERARSKPSPYQSAEEKAQANTSRFRDYYRRGLEQLVGVESTPLGAAVGAAVGLERGLGSLGTLLSAAPLSPHNVGAKLVDYWISRKPSDLVMPHPAGQGPAATELRALSEEFDEAFEGQRMAKFAAFVGEWVPALYGGAKAATAIQRLTMQEAPALIAGVGRSKLANRFSTKAAEAMAKAGDEMAASVAGRAAGEIVGGIPLLERTMMAVGNAAGYGPFEATRQMTRSGDTEVYVRDLMLYSGLGAGIEMAAVGAGRALFPSFRKGPIDVNKVWAEFEKLSKDVRKKLLAGDETTLKEIGGKLALVESEGTSLLSRGEKAIAKLVDLGILEQVPGFAKAMKLKDPAEAKLVLQRVGKLYEEADIKGVVKKMAPELKGLDLTARRVAIKGRIDAVHKAERELRATVADLDALDEAMLAPNLRRLLDGSPVSAQQRLDELSNLERVYDDMALDQLKRRGWRSPLTMLQQADVKLRKRLWSVYSDDIEGWTLKWLKSPSGVARQLGVPGLKLLQLMEVVEAEIKGVRSKIWTSLDEMSDGIARYGFGNKRFALNADGSVVTKGHEHWKPILDVYESSKTMRGGLADVERVFGPDIARLWRDNVVEPLDFFGQELRKLGVNSMMSDVELGLNRVSDYFPHLVRRHENWAEAEDVLRRILMRQGKNATQAQEIIDAGSWKRHGLQKFGTIDQQRRIVGSTRHKLKIGLPMEEDPLVALRDHLDASTVRLSLAKRFGPNGEMGSFYKAAIVGVGGSETAANQLVDTLLFENAAEQSASKLFRAFRTSQLVTKLTWSTIPNMMQTSITAVRFGPGFAARGVKETFQDVASEWRFAKHFGRTLATTDRGIIATNLGFMEKSILSGKTVFEGAAPKDLAESVSEIYLKRIGFTQTERVNRMIAAHAGLAHTRYYLEKMAKGEIRGSAYANARRSIDSLGVDTERVLARYRATGSLRLEAPELDQVITQSVKQTQFATGILDIPPAWRTPLGKVITQFKSFSFSAGKVMRDQVWREFDQGNYKPLLWFLTVGGVAGESIGAVLSFAKGRERDTPDGVARIVEDLSNFGGFGLAKAYADSLVYGRSLEFLFGPTVGTIADIGEKTAMYGPVEGLHRELLRQPTVQAINRGFTLGLGLLAGGANALSEGWEMMRSEDIGAVEGRARQQSGADRLLEMKRRMRSEGTRR